MENCKCKVTLQILNNMCDAAKSNEIDAFTLIDHLLFRIALMIQANSSENDFEATAEEAIVTFENYLDQVQESLKILE